MTKAEVNKIKRKIKRLDQEQQILAQKILDELVWMHGTLTKLKDQIDDEGPILTAINGNGFEVTTEHPAQRSYNVMIKNYANAIKQLAAILPEGGDDDELERFLAGR